MNTKTRMLVEGGLAAALAIALSYLKLWRMPQGGSVTLENIPLLIFSLRWGIKAGMGAGVVAGIVQLMLGGYVVHPVPGFCWITPWPLELLVWLVRSVAPFGLG